MASLHQDDYLRLLKQYPALALRAIEELGRRLREAQETIKSMAVEWVERRIARILSKLAATTGSSRGRAIILEPHQLVRITEEF